jgi:hypothetical protein
MWGMKTNQVVKFDSGNTLVDTGDDFLSNLSWVNVFSIQPITETGDTSCDFVELDAFLTAIYSNKKRLVSITT